MVFTSISVSFMEVVTVRTNRRHGYTIIEMVIVIVILGILTAVTYSGMKETKVQLDNAIEKREDHTEDIKVMNTIEGMLLGCDDVIVNPEELTVIKGDSSTKYGAEDIKSEVILVQDGENIIVELGGERYCLPIIRNK